jgi:hypothetical protein
MLLTLALVGCGPQPAPGTPSSTDPGWPATVTAPNGDQPELPAGPVGRAQVLYRCPSCPHWTIQLADGRRFDLPAAADVRIREGGGSVGGWLSPDGRWLALPGCPDDPGYAVSVRDLTTDRRRCLADRPLRWSANGSWVYTQQSLTNLDTGETHRVGSAFGLAGILDDGTLVTTAQDPDPWAPTSLSPQPPVPDTARSGALRITLVRPDSTRRSVDVAVDSVFSAAEQRTAGTGWSDFTAVRGDGTELTIAGHTRERSVTVRLSLVDGRVLGSAPEPDRGAWLIGYHPDGGWLYWNYRPSGTAELLRVSPAGVTTVQCSIPAGWQYTFRYDRLDLR